MLNLILKALLILILLGVVLIGAPYAISWWRRERPPDLTYVQTELVTEASRDLVRQMPTYRDITKVCVVPIVRDAGATDSGDLGRVGAIFFPMLDDAGRFTLRFWYEIDEENRKEYSEVRGEGWPTDIAEAVDLGRITGADGVLLVYLDELVSREEPYRVEVEMHAQLVDVEKAAAVDDFEPTYQRKIDSRWTPLSFAGTMKESSAIARFVAWIVLTLSVPFAAKASGLMDLVLRKRENALNLALLAGMTLVPFVAAWLLLGIFLGFFGVVLLLAGTGGAAYYNFDALMFFDKLK